jgi:hypothetical protein
LFALEIVTNLLKPEGRIKADPLKLVELDRRFAGYDDGTEVRWYVTMFDRPDTSVVRLVESTAQNHGLKLVLVE